MVTRRLIVVEPGRIELQDHEIDDQLASNQALVQAEYTVVSGGTEGSGYTGLVKEMPFGDKGQYPRETGYGHLGTVLETGSDVTMCRPGDRVISFSRHASLVKADASRMALPVSKEAAGKNLVLTRMAGVSISALRSSAIQPGDTVVVIGMGLVGNFAAQLFQMAGARVLVADLEDSRLDVALACGLEHTVNPRKADLSETVQNFTDGKGAHTVVEAIGVSAVINDAIGLVKTGGELILLGSPRAPFESDMTPFLLKVHLEAIKVIGALEWRWPPHPTERTRDIESNYRLIAEWITEGKLIVEPLISHLASPADCQEIYDGVTGRQGDFLGAVFDWAML
jgi:2-desacetyl-2-hydroxyethyl bacteriochlorophyllide A dehydrogenase